MGGERDCHFIHEKKIVIEHLLCPDLVPGTEGPFSNKTDTTLVLGALIFVEGD